MKISRNNVSNYALIKFNETNYLIKFPRLVFSARWKMAPPSRIEPPTFQNWPRVGATDKFIELTSSCVYCRLHPETINCCNYNNPGV